LASSQGNLKELKAKDQMVQSLEAQIQTLQTQLAQVRQEANDNSNQLAGLKTKLEESQKSLSSAQQRLGAASHEIERLNASRSQVASRPVSRPVEPAPPPQPAGNRTASRQPDPYPQPSSPPGPRRAAADTGVYETTRATSLYEDPSPSSRVVSQINKGTRINVVNSAGEWLEVRSRRGNPPGYIRADDARYVGASN
jgi:uncharacterized protein YgiM (DUF1202 family)